MTTTTTLPLNSKKGLVAYKSITAGGSGTIVNSEGRTICGYAAVFDTIDDAGDLLIRGCFAKSLKDRGPQSAGNRKIIMLWQHSMDEPIGKITTLEEDRYGLYFEAEIDKIPLGDRALEQIKSGTLNQFSIGYQYVWDKVTTDPATGVMIVNEVKLYEISVVSIGCNEHTGFEGLKNDQLYDHKTMLDRQLELALKELEIKQQYKLRQLITKTVALGRELTKNTQQPHVIERIEKISFI